MRDNWFAKVPAWVFLDEGLDAKEKLVFTAMSLFTNTQMRCYPSIQRLANFCSISEASVKRALRGLEEKGLILKKFRFERNIQTTTLYSLAKQRYEPPEAPPAGSYRPPRGVTQTPTGVHTDPPVGSDRPPEQNQLTDPINRASEQQNANKNDARAKFSEREGEKLGDTRQNEFQADDGSSGENVWKNYNRRRIS